ncbi:MAG: AraC family transcriptional regulator [Paludibacteraceae bacterium]|nr:AraC family transcriptional regulator [Paludibacteraceae bacterium]
MFKQNAKKIGKLRVFYYEYRSEVLFGFLLSAAVVLSYALSPLIPTEFFRTACSYVQNTATIVVPLISSWMLFRHHGGIRVRKIFAWIMAALAVLMIAGVFYRSKVNSELQPAEGVFSFEGWEMLAGDIIAWLLLAYPSELLRPGWLTWKNATTRLLPVIIIGVIDWFVPWDLRWLLAIVPLVWIILLYHHVRSYRRYCEDNFSSMEETDERWVIRYLLMMLILGISYGYLCFSEEPNRLFTQQWLLFFIFVYSNDQVFFHSKPWIERVESEEAKEEDAESAMETNAEYRQVLEEWMSAEKPYLNKDFRLTDLRRVLPLNRTYLSQLINSEYGCTFYQFVTNYRVEEAKRLMCADPKMKMQDIAEQCGFSSSTVFGRIFARETGMTPKEWSAKNDNL